MNYGLAPRPSLPPEEMAALIAAAEEILKEERRRVKDMPPAWRFSGRWFNSGPYALRRPHHLN
jgi:peptidoglycan/xylan/chitin deacetylase (PgdA/CDA1 family)